MVIEFEDGIIVTDLDDIDFLKLVLMNWGDYNENEAEALVADNADGWGEEMEDIGVLLTSNNDFASPEEIVLIKVGEGEWIVEDKEDWEMEDLVLLLGVDG